jgi:hypothetical protein
LGDVKTPALIAGGPGRASRVWGYWLERVDGGQQTFVRKGDAERRQTYPGNGWQGMTQARRFKERACYGDATSVYNFESGRVARGVQRCGTPWLAPGVSHGEPISIY